jgi:hypothetical protein
MNSGVSVVVDVSVPQFSKHKKVINGAIRHALSAVDPRMRSGPTVTRR